MPPRRGRRLEGGWERLGTAGTFLPPSAVIFFPETRWETCFVRVWRCIIFNRYRNSGNCFDVISCLPTRAPARRCPPERVVLSCRFGPAALRRVLDPHQCPAYPLCSSFCSWESGTEVGDPVPRRRPSWSALGELRCPVCHP